MVSIGTPQNSKLTHVNLAFSFLRAADLLKRALRSLHVLVGGVNCTSCHSVCARARYAKACRKPFGHGHDASCAWYSDKRFVIVHGCRFYSDICTITETQGQG